MGRRVPLRSLSFALALALAVSAVVLVVYDRHGALVTLAIVGPVGVATVLAGEAMDAGGTAFGAIVGRGHVHHASDPMTNAAPQTSSSRDGVLWFCDG